VLGLAAAAFLMMRSRTPTFFGTVLEPRRPAPEISLVDHAGGTFSLANHRAQVVLVFFGYTSCPDECPLTMATLREAFDILNEDGTRVQVALITTDPERDTPDALREYLALFHPSFLGLSGSPAQLQQVYADYGVLVMESGETHSTRVYVIDRRGDLRATFPYGQAAAEIAADVRLLLGEE